MNRAWISIGSNIEPQHHIPAALQKLNNLFGQLRISPIYQNAAEGFDGADFWNLVVGIETERDLDQVQALLKQIEAEQGRRRGAEKFSARTLDLDLLTWNDDIYPEQNLPRDEIQRYAFVLKPLADIAGDEIHPQLGISYAQLWQQFQPKPKLKAIHMEQYHAFNQSI